MRPAVAAMISYGLIVLALSGCLDDPTNEGPTDDSASTTLAADPIWNETTSLDFIHGTYQWHEPAQDGYDAATQTLVQACLYQAPDDDRAEPYFHNLQLTESGAPEQDVPAGTTHLDVTLQWDGTDWDGDELFLAWIGGNAERYRTGGPIPNGEPTQIPIANETWNTNTTQNWDVWVCLTRDETIAGQTSFVGDLDVDIRLARAVGNETT